MVTSRAKTDDCHIGMGHLFCIIPFVSIHFGSKRDSAMYIPVDGCLLLQTSRQRVEVSVVHVT